MAALWLLVVWLRLMAVSEEHVRGEASVTVAADDDILGCWGPCYTMSSHAALGVVRSGVAVLKGK